MRDGRGDAEVEPGYEKIEVGPTTNFVGNHMTQAAIDLVQAELHGDGDEACDMLALAGQESRVDRNLKREKVAKKQLKQVQPVDRYMWVDEGEKIRITLRTPARDGSIECTFTPEKVQVRLVDQSGWPHALVLQPLWSEIIPEICSWSQHRDKIIVQLPKSQNNPWEQLTRSVDTHMDSPSFTAKHEEDLRKLRKASLRRSKVVSSGPCEQRMDENGQGRIRCEHSRVDAGKKVQGTEITPGLLLQGEHLLNTGQYSCARELFEHIVQTLEDTKDVGKQEYFCSIYLGLAQCYLKEGRSSKAIDCCSHVLTNTGVSPENKKKAYQFQSKAMEDLEDFQGAHRSRILARTCGK